MRVVVDSYVYGLIKIASLERLTITHDDYENLKEILDDKKLLDAVDNFFPGVSKIDNPNIVNIEKSLFNVYFRIYEKILVASPQPMQLFLKSLLVRYEVWNIKTYILGKLANFSLEDIKKEILMRPEKVMLRENFIKKLLNSDTLDDAIRFLTKQTRYRQVIDRGWYYFQEKNEVFVLEALLDKFFIDNMISRLDSYRGFEKKIFSEYVENLVLKYNLMLIFRGITNGIPDELLKQFVIPQAPFLEEKYLVKLIESETAEHIVNNLKSLIDIKAEYLIYEHLERSKLKIRKQSPAINKIKEKMTDNDPITPILSYLDRKVFHTYEEGSTKNFDEKAIKSSLDLILRKEKEIYKVLALFVKIYHKLE